MDKEKIISYINNTFKDTNDFKILLSYFQKLCKFLKDMDPDDARILLNESNALYDNLKLLIKLGKDKFKKNLIKEYYDNDILNALIDAYFDKENLFIEDWLEEVNGKLLTDLEVRELVAKAKDGDIPARNRVIESNLGLVKSIAASYSRRTTQISFDELFQEGFFGLEKAVMKYNPGKSKFSTYATWWIRQTLTRYIYNNDRTVRIPVHMVERINRMLRVKSQLTSELNREASVEEIAKAMGKEPEEIEFLLEISNRPSSLDQSVGDDADSATLSNFVPDEDASYFADDVIDNIHGALAWEIAEKVLKPREYQVLCYRFGKYGIVYTLEETAKLMGGNKAVTRERIRQIESKAIRKLSTPNIKKMLDENNMQRVRNNPLAKEAPPKKSTLTDTRTLFERLSEFTEEEIIVGLLELSPYRRNILYEKFGSNLREVNVVSATKEDSVKTIIKRLKLILDDIRFNEGKNCIYDYLKDYSEIDIYLAILSLRKIDRDLIYKRFGANLDELNTLDISKRARLQYDVFPKLEELIRKSQILGYNKTIFEIINDYSKDDIIKAISFLDEKHQEILYSRFGRNLDELNTISDANLLELYQYVIPQLKQILSKEEIDIFEIYKDYSREEIIDAIKKLSPRQKEVVIKCYGPNFDEYNPLYANERKVLKTSVVKNIGKILNGELITVNKEKNETILEYFEGYTLDEIRDAIKELKPSYQSIVYKRYGANLDEVNHWEGNERTIFYSNICPRIKNVLNGKLNTDKRFKPLLRYFDGVTKEDLIQAINNLDSKYQEILYRRYGINLDEQNTVSHNDKSTIRQTIIPKLRKSLNGESVNKERDESILEYFEGYSLEEIKNAVDKLKPSYKAIVYRKYGANLNESNKVSSKDSNKLSRIIDKIRMFLDLSSCKKGNLFDFLCLSKEETLSRIEDLLIPEEREALYKYYGYDLESPKDVPLDNDFKNYVERIIFPKLMIKQDLELPPVGLKRAIDIANMVSKMKLLICFTKEELIVFCLRLGIGQDKVYSSMEVSDMLGIKEDEVNYITDVILVRHKKYFDVIYDNIMQLLYPRSNQNNLQKIFENHY